MEHFFEIERKVRYSAVAFTVLLGLLLCASSGSTSDAQVVPAVGFAATLLKALPTLGTVISNIFTKTKTNPNDKQKTNINQMKSETSTAMRDLTKYVKREQILGEIVGASGQASASVARMAQITAGRAVLTKAELDELKNAWPDVVEALDGIAKAKLDISVFDSDSLQIQAVNKIVSADSALKEKIAEQLKYDPSKPDETL